MTEFSSATLRTALPKSLSHTYRTLSYCYVIRFSKTDSVRSNRLFPLNSNLYTPIFGANPKAISISIYYLFTRHSINSVCNH